MLYSCGVFGCQSVWEVCKLAVILTTGVLSSTVNFYTVLAPAKNLMCVEYIPPLPGTIAPDMNASDMNASDMSASSDMNSSSDSDSDKENSDEYDNADDDQNNVVMTELARSVNMKQRLTASLID